MPLTLTDLITPASAAQWTTTILGYCTSLGLNTTSWQSGGVTRTILAVTANCLALVDNAVSKYAAGGYLDFAASTSVTPEYGPGFLDGISQSVFNVTRNPATQATSSVTFTNASASSYGPFAIGTFHVADANGNLYSDVAALTIAASTTTIATMKSDVAGISPAAVTTMVTSLVGVTCAGAAGSSNRAETNAALVIRCREKLASFASRTGATNAYTYYATATDETGYPVAATPITRAHPIADKIAGTVAVYLAEADAAPWAPNVALMRTYLQAQCTPDDTTMTCVAATPVTVAWSVTIYAPTDVSAAVKAAYVAFIKTLPVGGLPTENATTGVSLNQAEDYVARAVPTLRTQITTAFGGAGAVSKALAATEFAVAVTGNVAVTYGGV